MLNFKVLDHAQPARSRCEKAGIHGEARSTTWGVHQNRKRILWVLQSAYISRLQHDEVAVASGMSPSLVFSVAQVIIAKSLLYDRAAGATTPQELQVPSRRSLELLKARRPVTCVHYMLAAIPWWLSQLMRFDFCKYNCVLTKIDSCLCSRQSITPSRHLPVNAAFAVCHDVFHASSAAHLT